MANNTIWTAVLNWLSDTAITPTRLNNFIGKTGASIYGNLGFLNNATAIADPGGRLTLESGVPVSISDQLAKTTVYYTPYLGTIVGLYDSADDVWLTFQFAEILVAVPATTNTPFDIFIYDNAGTLTLEAVDWTDDTTRATALVEQDGVLVKSGATDRRYLGTGRTTSVSGQCQTKFGGTSDPGSWLLWNYYNRVLHRLSVKDATTHAYSSGTVRFWNNDTDMFVEHIIGVVEDSILIVHEGQFHSSADGGIPNLFVLEDNVAGALVMNLGNSNVFTILIGNSKISVPPLGYKVYIVAESNSGGGAHTYSQVRTEVLFLG